MIRRLTVTAALALVALTQAPLLDAQTDAVTIRAPRLIDGRGGERTDTLVTVKDGKIRVLGPATGPATYDLAGLTLLPGFIDTYVHISWHFDANGRYATGERWPVDVLRPPG